MKDIVYLLRHAARQAFQSLYSVELNTTDILINETKPEFEGNYTVVLFPFVKMLRKSPEQLGKEVGEYMLQENPEIISAYNVLKGFLNLEIQDKFFLDFLESERSNSTFGRQNFHGRKVMVEYSSPNTNKPLHLGHLRNIFLGWSVAELFKWQGYEVMKTAVVNDRGVHICKSMLAWQKFGNGATPESENKKGDHLVGDYYVQFESLVKEQTKALFEGLETGQKDALNPAEKNKLNDLLAEWRTAGDDEKAEKKAALMDAVKNATPIMREVQEMLVKWEQGDESVLSTWRTMNGWVYAGFDETYKRIGVDFDNIYYESETYLLGKDYVQKGLESGVFFTKPDGSVWIDLTDVGLDEKLVLRKDGTSVYITQDIGLADLKFQDFEMEKSLYVIADEQNYHMQVLREICKKLGFPFAEGILHLSYGMVELPHGRMKSREGTVVDADDMVDEMESVAEAKTAELGKVKDFTAEELSMLYRTLGLGALKYYLLRVEPKKKMVFNPEESIDFHGVTGPFIQYSYARIQSVLRKAGDQDRFASPAQLEKPEKQLLLQLEQFPATLRNATHEMNPSLLANYAYGVAKAFNSFYAAHSIVNADTPEQVDFRVALSRLTAIVIQNSLAVMGVNVPDRM